MTAAGLLVAQGWKSLALPVMDGAVVREVGAEKGLSALPGDRSVGVDSRRGLRRRRHHASAASGVSTPQAPAVARDE